MQFIRNSTDDSNEKWNDAPYTFYENKSCFEYNTTKLKDIGNPITRIKFCPNYVQDSKTCSNEANNLQAILYICVSSEVILTSNIWNEVRLNNSAKVNVINFFYIDASGPRNGGVPAAVVVQF